MTRPSIAAVESRFSVAEPPDEPHRTTPGSQVSRLRSLALLGLARMYHRESGLFVFRIRLVDGEVIPEGLSVRYTAIALLGLAEEDHDACAKILGGQTVSGAYDRLLKASAGVDKIGDAAVICWAARAIGCGTGHVALQNLLALEPATRACPVVDLSWALSALCHESSDHARAARDQVAARLMALFSERSSGFPHMASSGRDLRTHVACFADQVYPILALAHYAEHTGDERALNIARQGAGHICRLQGSAGQWWWHYDTRVDAIVERYPVYAVHQHAMAPMALGALQRVSGADLSEPIGRGLEWLRSAPEIGGASLIDERRGIVWRKVGRREPAKVSRYLQAAATRLSPGSMLPGLDRLFPPGAIDFECRPYELGWLLYAWRRGSRA